MQHLGTWAASSCQRLTSSYMWYIHIHTAHVHAWGIVSLLSLRISKVMCHDGQQPQPRPTSAVQLHQEEPSTANTHDGHLYTEEHKLLGIVLAYVVWHWVLTPCIQEEGLPRSWHLEQPLAQHFQLANC